MIRVVIADNQMILRESLKSIIDQEPGLKVVGSATDGSEVIELCGQLLPDVVLMDIKMPGCSGVEEIRLIKEKYMAIKIIILTSYEDEKSIFLALEYGVEGYLFKDVEPKMLTMAIRSVYYGMPSIHKKVLAALTKKIRIINKNVQENQYENTNLCFTQRELNILKGIIKGKSNIDIAEEIHLSKGRVANIITTILEKTHLNDRTQLAVFAVKHNIV